MAANDYICFTCGKHFVMAASSDSSSDKKCPKCGSANILKINPSNLFGFTGLGGGG